MPDSIGMKRKVPNNSSQVPDTNDENTTAIVKRPRSESGSTGNTLAISTKDNGKQTTLSIPRTSKLEAPNLKLTGHEAGVNSVKFDPNGNFLASGSFDKSIFIWNVFGECQNTAVLEGHKNSVQEICWLDSSSLCSASADKTVAIWDVEREARIRKFSGHDSFVNACCGVTLASDAHVVASASDDGTVQIWDSRKRGQGLVGTLAHSYQVTAVCASLDGNILYTGGLDNIVRAWDRRKESTTMDLVGHLDTITSLRISHDGNHVLSSSMDNTLRLWDIRPFVPNEEVNGRCSKLFQDTSTTRNIEKALIKCSISRDGQLIGSGSPSRRVCIWDTYSTDILYDLPGHTGTVMEVDIHPSQPIVVSCSTDRTIYLGEIAPVGS